MLPESLIWLCGPAARTVPVRVPVAPSKMPVPPTITSVSVPDPGKARLGFAPGHLGSLNVSSMKIEPSSEIDRAEIARPAAGGFELDRLGGLAERDHLAHSTEALGNHGAVTALKRWDDRLGERHLDRDRRGRLRLLRKDDGQDDERG